MTCDELLVGSPDPFHRGVPPSQKASLVNAGAVAELGCFRVDQRGVSPHVFSTTVMYVWFNSDTQAQQFNEVYRQQLGD